MSLPYETASSGEKATAELQRILSRFGCERFGTMTDNAEGVLICQFSYRSRDVIVRASFRGYAAAWLKEHPYNYSRMRSTKQQHEAKASEIGRVAVHSILRDWIKGQTMAIETGMLTFEGAFLGQLMLANGRTVLDEAMQDVKLLGAPQS